MARAIGWFLRWNRIRPESPESDAELLRRFSSDKESGTLEALIARHGGLVLGTCERILRDAQLAEDAFQAVFFVLAKRAGTIHGLLPAWLHKVAQRVCWRMLYKHRATVARHVTPPTSDDYKQQELLAVLDEEIARLPAKHRSVVQLCYLQDRTAEVAGQLLGIPRGTVLSRLDSARRKLQAAFARRGITSLAILTIPTLAATVSPTLAATSADVARGLASPSASTAVSLAITELTIMKLRTWIIAGMLAFGLLGLGGTVLVMQKAAAGDEAKKPKEPMDEKKKAMEEQLKNLIGQKGKVEDELKRAKLRHEDMQLAIQKDGLSERTLRTAIEKEEEKMLLDEENIKAAQVELENAKKARKKEVEMVIELGDREDFQRAVKNLIQLVNTKAWPKDVDPKLPELLLQRYQFTISNEPVARRKEVEVDIVTKLLPPLTPLIKKQYFEWQEDQINGAEQRVKAFQARLATTKARRDELLVRLARVTRNNANVLADDEFQIYRETRTALLKKIQQLELELAGVKLP
jgi:RNA polymerase sigma factor (sigma-70 family)